jgi:hypothetical protein
MAVYNIKMLFIYSNFIPNFWKPLFMHVTLNLVAVYIQQISCKDLLWVI